MLTRLFQLFVILLAAFVAVDSPLQMYLAVHDPAIAKYFGLEALQAVPKATATVVEIACVFQSLLMAYVVVELARVLRCFHRGQFFTVEVVRRLYRIGGTLVGMALLTTFSLGVAIITAAFYSDLVSRIPWWTHILNLPADTLVTGCVVLLVAKAFNRARKMAHEQRFTV
jgi:hypothetical protein